jgi:small subunit ribosomal protein S11
MAEKTKKSKKEKTEQEMKKSEEIQTAEAESTESHEEKSKEKDKKERIAILNIYTTFNNTIMNLTDLSGKSFVKFGGGQLTKQSRLKANPTVAMFIAQKIAEEAKDNGITGFYVKVRAETGQTNPGPGVHVALKSLTRAGFKILSIMDTTRYPRGGPKKKGGRRGRRV